MGTDSIECKIKLGMLLGAIAGVLQGLKQFQGALDADLGQILTGEILGDHDIVYQVQHGQQFKGLVDDAHVIAAPQGEFVFSELVDVN